MDILLEISISRNIDDEDEHYNQVRINEREKIKEILNPLLVEGYNILIKTRINK